jgi:hypothetical protein
MRQLDTPVEKEKTEMAQVGCRSIPSDYTFIWKANYFANKTMQKNWLQKPSKIQEPKNHARSTSQGKTLPAAQVSRVDLFIKALNTKTWLSRSEPSRSENHVAK